jgi:hypothetical protein
VRAVARLDVIPLLIRKCVAGVDHGEGQSVWVSGMEITIRDLLNVIGELTGFNSTTGVHAAKP